tara:strand:- start:42 stop:410 length:369 start_codon:yes stop_codon:yes gene_type:complete
MGTLAWDSRRNGAGFDEFGQINMYNNFMKNLNYFLLTTLLVGVSGNTAIAGQDPVNEKVEAILKKFDSNQDDIITQDEAGKFWKRLARADLNKDGEVTKEEMLKAWGDPPRPVPGPGPKPKK